MTKPGLTNPSLTFEQVKFERERRQCEQSLYQFSQSAWHVIEPAKDYVDNWHVKAICDHLEAITRGDINRLLINIPPRHMKSILTCVTWPVWTWVNQPWKRFLTTSYSSGLSTRDAVKSRRIIRSEWFQQRWGDVFDLTSDQDTKTRYENDKTGYRVASSVGGEGTGEGGDVIIADDPHKVGDAESQAERRGVIRWWNEEMSTRLDDPEEGAMVVIMQRIHHSDLSAEIIENKDYTHLMIPAQYEPDRHCSTDVESDVGPGDTFEDPRTEDGELLWPERFTEESLQTLVSDMSTHAVEGQLQQRPTQREGGMFKRQWFETVDDVPQIEQAVRHWDLADTDGGGSWTAGVLIGKRKGEREYYIMDVKRFQLSGGERNQRIKEIAKLDDKKGWLDSLEVGVEQEGGSGGKRQAKNIRGELAGFDTYQTHPTGSKKNRAGPLQSMLDIGAVKLKNSEWNKEFIDELCKFPEGENDDQVDGASGAFNRLHVDEPEENKTVGTIF